MKLIARIAGIALIVFGIAVFSYHGFSYIKQEKIVQVGDVKVTAGIPKKVYFSPLVGGISLAAGIVLLLI